MKKKKVKVDMNEVKIVVESKILCDKILEIFEKRETMLTAGILALLVLEKASKIEEPVRYKAAQRIHKKMLIKLHVKK